MISHLKAHRILLCLTVLVPGLAQYASQQAGPEQEPPVFHAQSTLVTLAFQVVKSHQFVDDLRREEVYVVNPNGVGDFTRFYLGEKPDVTEDFTAGDAVIGEFRKYLDQLHIKFTEPDIQDNLAWLKWKIKREVSPPPFSA